MVGVEVHVSAIPRECAGKAHLRARGWHHAEHRVEVVRARATRVDVAAKRVELEGRAAVPYDALLIATGVAHAQDAPVTKYWPLPKISFPMDVSQITSLNPRPVSVRFYAAPRDGKFELIANKKLDDLEQILDNADPRATPKRGFSYTAERSSEKEFAVQYEFER